MPVRTVRLKAKVCMAGDRAVGKTSVLRRFELDAFDAGYLATLGAKVSKKTVRLDLPERDLRVDVAMTIWDIMGDRTVAQLLQEAYFHGADGVLAVTDVTRRETLEAMSGWRDLVLRGAGEVPWVLAVNKVDLAEEATYGEADARAAAADLSAPVLFTSAQTGENVREAFDLLARRLLEAARV